MSADVRELAIQLLLAALCAVTVVLAVPRIRRLPRWPARLAAALVVVAVVVTFGVLEARLLSALVAGAGLGVLGAGTIVLWRSRGTASRLLTRLRVAALVATAIVGALPLASLVKRAAGESVMSLTRAASEGSGGSWATAWQRSWDLLLDPDFAHLRVSLAASWALLLGIALVLVALVSTRMVRWGTPTVAPVAPAPLRASDAVDSVRAPELIGAPSDPS